MDNVDDLQLASSWRAVERILARPSLHRSTVWGIVKRKLNWWSDAVPKLQNKTCAVCLALRARVLVASRLLQRTQQAMVSVSTPGRSFQTRVPDRQGPSRDFQIRAALSLSDRDPAKMLAEMLAATGTPNHTCARRLLCPLRLRDIEQPTNRVVGLISPSLACLALFAFVQWRTRVQDRRSSDRPLSVRVAGGLLR
jgi:hypothetical protein